MISVCIATYNGEKYIKEQLTSILSQLSDQDELILSDDCSTDNTLEIVRAFNDSRIRILEGRRFGSPAFNFENALKNATGDVIMLSDQDDIWREDKVEIILERLRHYDLVFSDALVIDAEGQIIRSNFFTKKPWKCIPCTILSNKYLGPTMAFKRTVLEKSLPFPKRIPMHDQWIGMVARIYYTTEYIDIPLIGYRRHGNNASYCGEKSKNNLLRKILFRINLVVAIISKVLCRKNY